ncbi:MAG: hypothetical protein FJZ92_10425 [Chloroflexi bacterium]|nr:hypothetical protein [Chloroflexota bacterium]
MPVGQALINLIANNAIGLTGGVQPKLLVNLAALRALLQPEQAALTAAAIRQRRDVGTMTLNPPGGGAPVGVPTVILMSANGSKPRLGGAPLSGAPVTLGERGRNGHILVVAGGKGDGTPSLVPNASTSPTSRSSP